MSTLIVLMPPRDPAVHSQEWQLPELPFVLLDKAGNTQRAGRSALGELIAGRPPAGPSLEGSRPQGAGKGNKWLL